MNIASVLIPKSGVACLYDDFTLRQALEKMRYHGYTFYPVLSKDNDRYLGTVTEGDMLWHLLDSEDVDMMRSEDVMLKEAVQLSYDPPIPIDMNLDEAMHLLVDYEYLPVVDDRDLFIGIVKRGEVIRKILEKNLQEKKEVETV